MSKRRLVAVIFFCVLVADQALKIWVKTNMAYGEEFSILGFDWALVHFVENNGMAFGLGVGGPYGKLLLTVFRIVTVVLLGAVFLRLLRGEASRWFLAGFALVLAGAIGNIIDSVFYGVIFSASEFHGGPATFLPPEGGYAPLLHGRVVDMLYFPLAYGNYPDWLPLVGGRSFVWFSAIFNIADVAINLGVVVLIASVFRGRRGRDAAVEEE